MTRFNRGDVVKVFRCEKCRENFFFKETELTPLALISCVKCNSVLTFVRSDIVIYSNHYDAKNKD